MTLPRLCQLSLDGYPLGNDAKALAENPALANLTRLSLRNCGIGDRGLTAIANSPHLRQLMELDLVSNKLKTAHALRDRTLLPRLTLARLEYNSLSPAVVQNLYTSRAVRTRPRFESRFHDCFQTPVSCSSLLYPDT